MALTQKSLDHLDGVHPDLARVVIACATSGRCAFQVTEGLRDLDRQHQLFAEGKSKTLKSRHLTGHAVDLVAIKPDGQISYAEADMMALADAMKASAASISIPIEWGGDWKSFQDTPHYQLPLAQYPATAAGPTIEVKATRIEDPTKDAPAAPPPAATTPSRDWAAVTAAMRASKTIGGALLTFLGAVVQWGHDVLTGLCDAVAAAASYAPVQSLAATLGANTQAVGFGLTAFGALMVLQRRLDAAAKGKIG